MTPANDRETARRIVADHDDILSDYPSMRGELIDAIAAALTRARREEREIVRAEIMDCLASPVWATARFKLDIMFAHSRSGA